MGADRREESEGREAAPGFTVRTVPHPHGLEERGHEGEPSTELASLPTVLPASQRAFGGVLECSQQSYFILNHKPVDSGH